MRLGIVSDVHCRHEELALVAQRLVDEGVDEILFAGDGHYEYSFSNEVVELSRNFGMRYVLGNHEAVLLGRHGVRARSAPHVRRANLEYLESAPTTIRTTIDGRTLTMVHANPFADDYRYLYPGDTLFDRCDELDTDYLVLGHTHIPSAVRHGRTLVINPGSLMFSRDEGGHGRPTYAILDTTTDEVRLERDPPAS
jgi:putative phosphoesterase